MKYPEVMIQGMIRLRPHADCGVQRPGLPVRHSGAAWTWASGGHKTDDPAILRYPRAWLPTRYSCTVWTWTWILSTGTVQGGAIKNPFSSWRRGRRLIIFASQIHVFLRFFPQFTSEHFACPPIFVWSGPHHVFQSDGCVAQIRTFLHVCLELHHASYVCMRHRSMAPKKETGVCKDYNVEKPV
jgi:hypothetical protein